MFSELFLINSCKILICILFFIKNLHVIRVKDSTNSFAYKARIVRRPFSFCTNDVDANDSGEGPWVLKLENS